ncbi:hypothetical protein FRB90_002265 [Tulasnella sp. 427]|nr:hypothetical protein FRB90_002265 [Tulasnella sp. 427]
MGLFKRITADVKLSDEEYVKNEKERDVPWSVTPFKEARATNHREEVECEEESERPPEWLELAGDLAWTTTFSSLTSNTSVTEPISVWNYGVFFALTWHLWATQTSYDIKYYTNDWWHRALFASQLAIYAILAAFSGSFNVGWELDNDATDPFTGNSTALTSQTIVQNSENSIEKSFRGVNILLCISRLLLFAQYVRVLWYRRKSKRFSTWRFYLPAISTFIAALLFLGCFGLIKDKAPSKSVAITQLSIWGLAIFVQVIAGALTPEDEEGVLRSKSTLPPRMSTLTVIILGEGLNGICDTLRNSINSLGMTKTMTGEMIAMLLVLYFMWLLYFDGFHIRSNTHKAMEDLWLWSHFPLHLSMIMLLEGIKNLFLYTNVIKAISVIQAAFVEIGQFEDKNNGTDPEHPRLEALLQPLKLSWQQELQDIQTAAAAHPDDPDTASSAQLYRWVVTIVHSIYLLFNDEPDPEAEFKFNNFISSNDTYVVSDIDSGEVAYAFQDRYNELMSYTAHWLLAVAGTLLICMAIVNIMERRPKNRYAWAYSLNRISIGIILILVGAGTSKSQDNIDWLFWITPLVAICYAIATGIDLVILKLSRRSIKKKEDAFPGGPDEKVAYSTGRAQNRQFSEASTSQLSLKQRERQGSAAGTPGAQQIYQHDVYDPYAEAGAPYLPRSHGSRGSTSDPTAQSLLGKYREEGM